MLSNIKKFDTLENSKNNLLKKYKKDIAKIAKNNNSVLTWLNPLSYTLAFPGFKSEYQLEVLCDIDPNELLCMSGTSKKIPVETARWRTTMMMVDEVVIPFTTGSIIDSINPVAKAMADMIEYNNRSTIIKDLVAIYDAQCTIYCKYWVENHYGFPAEEYRQRINDLQLFSGITPCGTFLNNHTKYIYDKRLIPTIKCHPGDDIVEFSIMSLMPTGDVSGLIKTYTMDQGSIVQINIRDLFDYGYPNNITTMEMWHQLPDRYLNDYAFVKNAYGKVELNKQVKHWLNSMGMLLKYFLQTNGYAYSKIYLSELPVDHEPYMDIIHKFSDDRYTDDMISDKKWVDLKHGYVSDRRGLCYLLHNKCTMAVQLAFLKQCQPNTFKNTWEEWYNISDEYNDDNGEYIHKLYQNQKNKT